MTIESADEQALQDVSNSFWANQPARYPNYGTTKKRRLCEVNYLLGQLKVLANHQQNTLVDIGCGTGSTVTILQELADFSQYFCYDISPGMLSTIDTRSVRGANVSTEVLDLSALPASFFFAEADFAVCFAVFQYLSDEMVCTLLSKINARILFCRDACYLPHEGPQYINTFSEQLQANYSCRYRTLTQYIDLCTNSGWHLKDVRRAFPDDIESDFGSKQWFLQLAKE